MDKGNIGFWLGVIVLIIAVSALGAYSLPLFFDWLHRDPVDLDTMDNVNRPESNRPFDDFDEGYTWDCCDHCYDEHGNLIHSLNMLDNHTVPCNEVTGEAYGWPTHCQEF